MEMCLRMVQTESHSIVTPMYSASQTNMHEN